jgi:hypothetical protein
MDRGLPPFCNRKDHLLKERKEWAMTQENARGLTRLEIFSDYI